jgi:hypothetical protein
MAVLNESVLSLRQILAIELVLLPVVHLTLNLTHEYPSHRLERHGRTYLTGALLTQIHHQFYSPSFLSRTHIIRFLALGTYLEPLQIARLFERTAGETLVRHLGFRDSNFDEWECHESLVDRTSRPDIP